MPSKKRSHPEDMYEVDDMGYYMVDDELDCEGKSNEVLNQYERKDRVRTSKKNAKEAAQVKAPAKEPAKAPVKTQAPVKAPAEAQAEEPELPLVNRSQKLDKDRTFGKASMSNMELKTGI